jgi:hypothetical protein
MNYRLAVQKSLLVAVIAVALFCGNGVLAAETIKGQDALNSAETPTKASFMGWRSPSKHLLSGRRVNLRLPPQSNNRFCRGWEVRTA